MVGYFCWNSMFQQRLKPWFFRLPVEADLHGPAISVYNLRRRQRTAAYRYVCCVDWLSSTDTPDRVVTLLTNRNELSSRMNTRKRSIRRRSTRRLGQVAQRRTR